MPRIRSRRNKPALVPVNDEKNQGAYKDGYADGYRRRAFAPPEAIQGVPELVDRYNSGYNEGKRVREEGSHGNP
jgi:hypothetical protein